MKKTDKMILGIFSSFLAIGCIALAAGITMGAKPHEFLSIQLGKGEITLLGFEQLFELGKSIEEVEDLENERRFSAKDIEELKINVNSGIVEVSSTSGEEIICYSNRSDSFYRHKGNSLILEDERELINVPIKLKLYLPEKIWEEVEMELGACSVYLEEMKVRKMSLELGTGQLEADRLETEKSMDIQLGAGLIEVKGCLAKKLELECGMGSMDISMEGAREDYNYKLECGMGNLQISFTQE